MGNLSNRGRKPKRRTRKGNGQGTISLRADGRWMGRLVVGTDESGKSIRPAVYGKSSEEVDLKLSAMKIDLGLGINLVSSDMLFGFYSRQWLSLYKKPTITAKTMDFYNFVLKCCIWPSLEKTALKEITGPMCQLLINKLIDDGKSHRTLSATKLVLNQIFEQAIEDKAITFNPARKLKLPPKIKKTVKYLSWNEQANLEKAMKGTKAEAPIMIFLYSGLRLGELIGLHLTDIDLGAKRITVRRSISDGGRALSVKVTKNRKERIIPIPQILANVLQPLVDAASGSNILFPYPETKWYYNPSTFRDLLYFYCDTKKIPHINPHALRHTYATRLLERRVPLRVVMELLGHSSITVTADTYTHVIPQITEHAAAALDDPYLLIDLPTDKQSKQLFETKKPKLLRQGGQIKDRYTQKSQRRPRKKPTNPLTN
jgi:integrase